MTALRERIADTNRNVDWRRNERVRELDRQEDDARLLGKRLRDLKAYVSNAVARPAVPALIDEVRRLHAALEPNLVRNAADAMAGIDGRARILKASTSVADSHASTTVADTGVGI
jgi:C4-dicarboxylate-specific signal transduction histidine kinase